MGSFWSLGYRHRVLKTVPLLLCLSLLATGCGFGGDRELTMSGPPLISAPPTTQAQGEIDFDKARKTVLRREDLPSGYSLAAPAQSLPITPEIIDAYRCAGLEDYRAGVSADWQGPMYSMEMDGIPGARTAFSTVQVRTTAERAKQEYEVSMDSSRDYCMERLLSTVVAEFQGLPDVQVQAPKVERLKGMPSGTIGMTIEYRVKGEARTLTIRQIILSTVVDRAAIGVSYIDVGPPVPTSEALAALDKVRKKAEQEYPTV